MNVEVCPLRSAAGRIRYVTLARMSARPLTTTKVGLKETPLQKKPAGGRCVGCAAANTSCVEVVARTRTSTDGWSNPDSGTVFVKFVLSTGVPPCTRVTGKLGKSIFSPPIDALTSTYAFKLGRPRLSVSQLTGPTKVTKHGVDGHSACAFVASHSGAATGSGTWTGRATVARRSMSRTNGIDGV